MKIVYMPLNGGHGDTRETAPLFFSSSCYIMEFAMGPLIPAVFKLKVNF